MSSGKDRTAGLARIVAVVLCLAAAVLIVLILSNSTQDLGAKAVLAVVMFVPFSLCALAGFLLIERQPQLAALGMATVALSVATYFVLLDTYLSGGLNVEQISVGELAIGTIAIGQGALLLSFKRDDDSLVVKRALFGSIAALVALVGLAVVEINDWGDIGPKPFGIASVLYLLGVLLAPLLRLADALET